MTYNVTFFYLYEMLSTFELPVATTTSCSHQHGRWVDDLVAPVFANPHGIKSICIALPAVSTTETASNGVD